MYVPDYDIVDMSCPYFYPNSNSKEFQVAHCLSIHKDKQCLTEDGEPHAAFSSEVEALQFVRDSKSFNAPAISYHEVIRYDGTLVQFVEPKNGAWHAGKNEIEFKGHWYLNRHSVGIALLRNANKPKESQYTENQYRTFAHRILHYNPKYPKVDKMVFHKELSPSRRTDPDNFRWDKFEKALKLMK